MRSGGFTGPGVAACAILAAGCAGGPGAPAGPGVAAGAHASAAWFDAARVRLQEALDAGWRDARARADPAEVYPGATAAFVAPDGRVATFATGWADDRTRTPMPLDAVMPAGSVGKTFVAAAALSLAAEGRLSLDDPVARWLGDEDWFGRVPNGADLTVRMLLHHGGGLPDHVFEVPAFAADLRASGSASGPLDGYGHPEVLVSYVLDAPALFPAGQGFHYTDTGYVLVGMVIGRVAGAPWDAVVRRRFLEPLRLDRTSSQRTAAPPGLVQGHAEAGHETFGVPRHVVGPDGRLLFDPAVEGAGGGFYSHPGDLVRWARALFEGRAMPGDYRGDLLAPNPAPAPGGVRYGLGVRMAEVDGHGVGYGHYGFFPGYTTGVVYLPRHGVAVALQINSDRSALPRRLEELVAALLAQPVGRATPGDPPT